MMVCFTFLKMMMFVFNGVIFLGGTAVLGIGIWVKVDSSSLVKILGAAAPQLTQLINVGYLCIGVGCFLLLIGFLGCWGAVKESKCMLLMFFVVVLILFIVEVSGAVVVLVFSAVADIFLDHLKSWALKTLKENYGKQEDITGIWDTTMREGCLREFQTFLNRNGKIVGGVALGIAVLEVIAHFYALLLPQKPELPSLLAKAPELSTAPGYLSAQAWGTCRKDVLGCGEDGPLMKSMAA
ncbi:hypothetical protein lerEdw1_002165 [Lerista edwardsae]|nr:hypothetical protein lerEdw1_002165 [Lerista edwardsae]